MKKLMVLVIVMVVLGAAGVGYAAEDKLGIDVDVTWVSKYIWRGFDRLDDKAAFQPSINLDLGSGFSANVWSSHAGSSGSSDLSTVDAEEWQYTIAYANTVLDGEPFRTDWVLEWRYYDYPDRATKTADMQEFVLAFAWPDICPFGTVPSYAVIMMWPTEGGGAARDNGGFLHVFGLSYSLDVPELGQPLDFSVQAIYNDGTGDQTVDHDWSHIVWGVSTSIACGQGTFTPGLYYQTSMEDTVNPEDEFWVGLSYGFSF